MHRLSGAESGFASSSSALCFFPKHMLMSQYLLLRSQLECWWCKSVRDEKTQTSWTSLVVQWSRICLPVQETQVLSLVPKDSACHKATEPVCHHCWAHGLQPLKPTRSEATAASGLCTATREQNPLMATRESPQAAMKTRCGQQQIHTQINFLKNADKHQEF